MNLAQAEIHMALATVFRRLGTKMQLYDTLRERDVDVKHDFFVTNPSLDSRGVRVTLHSSNFQDMSVRECSKEVTIRLDSKSW